MKHLTMYLALLSIFLALPVLSRAQTVAPTDTAPPTFAGAQYPVILYNLPLTAGHASISATTLITAPATGTYRLITTASLTVIGASCAAQSTEAVNLIYQDPNAASAQTVSSVTTYQSDTGASDDGTVGTVATSAGAQMKTFRALGGTAIQVSTTYTAGTSCSPGPTIQIVPVLEALGQ